MKTRSFFAYVGSRTSVERNARGEGISVYRIDQTSGALDLVQVLGHLVNPSFLALNSAGDRLYSVHGDEYEVSAFEVNSDDGTITHLNTQHCGGKNPVHLALDPSGKFLVVSNHLSHNVAVLPIDLDGKLGNVIQIIEMIGTPGPHRKEQPFAKPHFNPFDPSGQFVIVPDKGLDKVFSFRFKDGQLAPADKSEMTSREGAGPRHIVFHPTQPWSYVINELDSTVTACKFDSQAGGLMAFQVISALSDSFIGNSRASEIAVHPAGHTVYASNRGEDSIAVLAVDDQTGRLRLIQTISSGGKTPRFFALSPDGHWLYVHNEDSDSIVTLAVNAQTGMLQSTNQIVRCGSPVCMVFTV